MDMTQSRTRIRRSAVALVGAATVLSISPIMAKAQDSVPVDPGVRCAAKLGTAQYECYLPSERATDVNGNKWVCGPDGQWFRDYSSLIVKASLFSKTSLISTSTLV